MIKIWLDDNREAPSGYIRTKSVETTIELLRNNDVEIVDLDNDLGTELEGRHVANWIEKQVINDLAYQPPVIYIHTSNSAARKYMETTRQSIANQLAKRLFK